MVDFLRKSCVVSGNGLLIEEDPSVLDFRSVIHVPENDPNCSPGIFDFGRKRIPQASYFRGPDPESLGYTATMTYRAEEILEYAPDEVYIYLGKIHSHIGHFLLSTFARLWSSVCSDFPDARILIQSDREMDYWFGFSHIKDLLTVLDLKLDRFVRFTRPVKISRLVLPTASFEEGSFAHRIYARLCNQAGCRLAGDLVGPSTSRPVYFSKSRLKAGVRRMVNEDDICERLEKGGIEIVYPEQLTLREQVALWHNRSIFAGFTGSAFHVGALAPPRSITMVSYNEVVDSNFVLSDSVNRSRATYLSLSPGGAQSLGASPNRSYESGFADNMRVNNPVGVAESLLRSIDFDMRQLATRHALGDGGLSRRMIETARERTPLLNAALDKPTSQSSFHQNIPNQQPNATSGELTGGFQCQTRNERQPWWQVDLVDEVTIHSIIIYNRCDIASERFSRFAIYLGMSELGLEIAFAQEEACAVGGLSGLPFVWKPSTPVVARYVRIICLDTTYLHLDQVEVLSGG